MNGFTKRLLSGAVLVGGMSAAGCTSDHYAKVADPCWPDRYSNESRKLAVGAFEPQVMNGHILDQTVWNRHFDAGTDRLNAAGMDKLDQLSRRRPQPDPRIFLQTTRDLPYNPDEPEKYATTRTELDTKRVAAIKKYLGATLTGRPATFDVLVHDPAEPGIDGAAPRVVIPPPRNRIGGTTGGAGAVPGAGAAPPAGGPPAGGATPPPPPPSM